MSAVNNYDSRKVTRIDNNYTYTTVVIEYCNNATIITVNYNNNNSVRDTQHESYVK